jgi:hypothetical protein
MDWTLLVEKKCGMKIEKRQRFFSRRNEVFYIEGKKENSQPVKYAVKVYCQGENFLEPFILKELAALGVKVPQVIWHNENIMVTGFISGVTLADFMGAGKNYPTKLNQGSGSVAETVCTQHADRRLLFFIPCRSESEKFHFDGKDFFGLDFEELTFYYAERDLGGLAAFILNSDPMFIPWKYDFVAQLIKTYAAGEKLTGKW